MMTMNLIRTSPVAHDAGATVTSEGMDVGVLVEAIDDEHNIILVDITGEDCGPCPCELVIEAETVTCTARSY